MDAQGWYLTNTSRLFKRLNCTLFNCKDENMTTNSKRISMERIQILFNLAKKVAPDKPELANRYVEIARRIAMRTQIHLPREYQRYICKHCGRFIMPGTGLRVRLQSRREPHIVFSCIYCNGKVRMPLRRRKRT